MALDIANWLMGLGLQQYEKAFRDNDIDPEILPKLTPEDLMAIGINSVGHRRKLIEAIASLGIPRTTTIIGGSHGTPNQTERRTYGAERRHLTVMFVDLVGSTALSERLDPEDMRTVITRYQNTVAGVATRFEGHVAKYMGDGVLCYFGWPNAHEDDAERAVRAGLAITAAVTELKAPGEEPLSARVGIATGLVVVGDLIGAGAAQEQAVVGDTPNFAARLQGIALPGQVVLAEATRRLLGDLFDVINLGGQSLKGIAGQAPAYGVIGERIAESRFEARASGTMSNMVGRDHELALMLERWKQSKTGEGQLVLLSGEAGIGKSRLTRGMIDAVSAEAHIRVSYQCSPYHSDSPLYPIIQQLTFAAGIAPDDDNDDKLDRLEKVLVGPEGDRPLLAALLGLQIERRYGTLNLTTQQQRTRTLHALVVTQLVELSRTKPVLLVLEDAHWIDATTLEVVDLCLDRVASAGVMMLVTTRPIFQPGFGGHPIVTKLALNRLGRDQIASIINGLTNGKALPVELLDVIAAKTDGVPLFVEEITKTVLESGELRETASAYELTRPLSRITIPATLYDSLMARLDRLQPVKEVAQTAACIGRDFDYRLLKAISPLDDSALQDALERLTNAELVFRRGAPPDATYIFKHALVRDAAYENLLKTRRQTIHTKLVEALETIEAAPELLAHHATAAGMTGRAIRYWFRAGEQAASRSANKEAVSHLKSGIELLEGAPNTAEKLRLDLDLHSALASVLMVLQGYGSDEVGKISTRTVELCRKIGDEGTLAAVLWQAWIFNYTRANHKDATPIGRELDERMTDAADPAARIVAHVPLGLSLFAIGKPLEARTVLDKAIQTYSELKGGPVAYRYGMDVGAVALAYRSWCLAMLGHSEKAIEDRGALLENLESIKHPFTLARAQNWCSMISAVQRDWRGALQFADRAIELAREYDLQMVGALGLAMHGFAHAAVDPISTSAIELRNGLNVYRCTGARVQVPFLLSLFAEASLARMNWSDSMSAISEALSLIEETGESHVVSELYRIRGDLLVSSKKADSELDYFKALELARLQGTRLFELRAAMSLVQLWTDQRKRTEARDLLAPIYDWFTEGLNTPDLKRAKLLLESLK
jgi:class 3 adenylate cyclase/predicted ATPase